MREKTTKMILQQKFFLFSSQNKKKIHRKTGLIFFIFVYCCHPLATTASKEFFKILQQRHANTLGRTAFYGPVHVNPFGLTHVFFHYGFLWDFAGLAERVYDNYDDLPSQGK